MNTRIIRRCAAAAAAAAIACAAVVGCEFGSGGTSAAALTVAPHIIAGMTVKPAVSNMAFSPDGKTLAVELENGLIQLRDARTGKTTATFNPHEPNSGEAFTFSPDGKTLAVAVESAGKPAIEFLSTRTLKPTRTLAPNLTTVYSLAFSPDGKALAVGAGKFVGLITLSTGTSLYVPATAPGDTVNGEDDPGGEAYYVSYSADGNWLAVSGPSGQVKLWNVRTGQFTKTTTFSPAGRGIPTSAYPSVTTTGVSVSPDGTMVAIGGSVGSYMATDGGYRGAALWLWNTRTGKITSLEHGTITQADDSGIGGVAFNRQGTILATGDDEGTIQLRNPATGTVIATAYSPTIGDTQVAFSPDGKTLASAEWIQTSAQDNGLTGGLHLWDVYSPARVKAPTAVTASDLLSAPVPAACEHAAGTLAYGAQRGLGRGVMALAWLGWGKKAQARLTAFGSLTGGSTTDAATILICNAGGEMWPQIIAFYGPGPKLLGWSYLTDFRLPGTQSGENTDVRQISYRNGEITAEWSTQDAGDPASIATVDYTADLRLAGGKITAIHLTADDDRQAVAQFLTDVRADDQTAVGAMSAPGLAAQVSATFRSYPSALTATPACYGIGSSTMPAPVSALAEGGPEQVDPGTDRFCALPTTKPGAQWIVLGLQHTAFGKWRILWIRTA